MNMGMWECSLERGGMLQGSHITIIADHIKILLILLW